MLEKEREIFSRYLSVHGLRMTRERTILFEEVFGHHDHFDAEELVLLLREKEQKVSRATVYRTLDLLVDCGLVARLRLDGNQFKYEHLHPGEHHDHLVCLHCGEIYEFASEEIERLQDEVCRQLGFHPRAHTHRIEGCCARCYQPESPDAEAL